VEIQPLDRVKILPEDPVGVGLSWGKVLDELGFGKDLRYRSEKAI
jgi:hypothetical protein